MGLRGQRLAGLAVQKVPTATMLAGTTQSVTERQRGWGLLSLGFEKRHVPEFGRAECSFSQIGLVQASFSFFSHGVL